MMCYYLNVHFQGQRVSGYSLEKKGWLDCEFLNKDKKYFLIWWENFMGNIKRPSVCLEFEARRIKVAGICLYKQQRDPCRKLILTQPYGTKAEGRPHIRWREETEKMVVHPTQIYGWTAFARSRLRAGSTTKRRWTKIYNISTNKVHTQWPATCFGPNL